MSDDDILRTIGAAALTMWALLALTGWVLPLCDGVARFTFRYLAWGALIVCWLCQAATADRWWMQVLNYLLMLWAVDRVAHWWRLTEKARTAR